MYLLIVAHLVMNDSSINSSKELSKDNFYEKFIKLITSNIMPQVVVNKKNRVAVNNDYACESGRRNRGNKDLKGRKVDTAVKADALDADELSDDSISKHIKKLEELFSQIDCRGASHVDSNNNGESTSMLTESNLAVWKQTFSDKAERVAPWLESVNLHLLYRDDALLNKHILYSRVCAIIRYAVWHMFSQSLAQDIIPKAYYEQFLAEVFSSSDQKIMSAVGYGVIDIYQNRGKEGVYLNIASRLRDLIMLPYFSKNECAYVINNIVESWKRTKSSLNVAHFAGDIYSFMLDHYISAEIINVRMMHHPEERENLRLCAMNAVEEQIQKFCERVVEAKERFAELHAQRYVAHQQVWCCKLSVPERAHEMGYQNICNLICDHSSREILYEDMMTSSIYWEEKSLGDEGQSERNILEFALELAAFFYFDRNRSINSLGKKIERGESFRTVFSEAWSSMRPLISECIVAKDKCVADTAFSHVTQIEDVVASSVCCDRSQDIHSV